MHNASLDMPFETVGGSRRVLHSIKARRLTGRHNNRQASSIPGCCTLKPDTGSSRRGSTWARREYGNGGLAALEPPHGRTQSSGTSSHVQCLNHALHDMEKTTGRRHAACKGQPSESQGYRTGFVDVSLARWQMLDHWVPSVTAHLGQG